MNRSDDLDSLDSRIQRLDPLGTAQVLFGPMLVLTLAVILALAHVGP
jgi:hypothetical protein